LGLNKTAFDCQRSAILMSQDVPMDYVVFVKKSKLGLVKSLNLTKKVVNIQFIKFDFDLVENYCHQKNSNY